MALRFTVTVPTGVRVRARLACADVINLTAAGITP
jgi:hypothetical protein